MRLRDLFEAAAFLCVLGLWLLASTRAVAAETDTPGAGQKNLLAQGQRIYREGVSGDKPITAVGAAQVSLRGKDAACMNCHRRSGFGGSEGRITIRPITAPALTQESSAPVRSPRVTARLGTTVRPPYTPETLARALRAGIDSSGRALDRAMPRYDLSDEDFQALSAYLFSLSAQPSEGVDEGTVHFATVLQPGVPPEKRRAILDVMHAFLKDKNSNMRQDERRREIGNMKMYQVYRSWKLHVWDLSGPSDTWRAQLEAFYREQPVFALLGGLGAQSWEPIRAFSDRYELPSVFPQVDLQSDPEGQNYYTFYFSRGVGLEAEALARHLEQQGGSGPIVQVFRPGDAGAVAAAALRKALAGKMGGRLNDVQLEAAADEAFWQALAHMRPQAVVLWLGGTDAATAGPLLRGEAPAVYLSYQLAGGRVPEKLRGSAGVRMVTPAELPPRQDARLMRARHWLVSRGVAPGDEGIQTNTLFTLAVVSDVIGHLSGNFSRDYLVERIEHTVGQTPMPSVYPQVSLGPGQRYAAKRAQIVEFGQGDPRALSGWIVP